MDRRIYVDRERQTEKHTCVPTERQRHTETYMYTDIHTITPFLAKIWLLAYSTRFERIINTDRGTDTERDIYRQTDRQMYAMCTSHLY